MRKNFIYALYLLLAVTSLTSCLKDDEFDNWTDDVKGKMYATFATPGLQTKSLLPVADAVTIDILVNIATDAVPTKDYTINLALDDAAIAAYNAKQLALDNKFVDYVKMPSVELVTKSLTIPAGRRNGYAQIKVSNVDKVDLAGKYMTAVSITSAEGLTIASNMKTVLYAFPIANQYEGLYTSDGYRNHPTAGMQPFSYTKIKFSTVNANTVKKDIVGNYTGYGVKVSVTTDVIVINGVNCYKCTLQLYDTATGADFNDFGMYSTFEGGATNYYNPVTKTFELYYFYNSAAPRIIRETNVLM